MNIERFGYDDCINTHLEETDCYGLAFVYDFQNDYARIDYWIFEDEDNDEELNTIMDDSESFGNEIYFPERDYTYFTKNKSDFPKIEKMFVDRTYDQMDTFIKQHEQQLKDFKMVLNKSGYYREQKLERLLDECNSN